MTTTTDTTIVRNAYETELNQHWEDKTHDDINLLLGAEDSLYHHHYSASDFNRSLLTAPQPRREKLIAAEMHRLETEQVDLIINGLGQVTPDAVIMDAGSGRGGTSFLLARRFGCRVEGVNFCTHHVEFSTRLAERFGCQDQVHFTYANMASTPFADAAFDHIVSNETTMYVDLPEAFAEFSRLLRPGGRYALVTWCSTGTTAGTAPEVDAINQHYVCKIHPRSHYLQALLASNLIPIQVTDLTSQALPYWELRASSRMATGVEPHFINAYQAGNMNYLVIVAERKP